MDSAPSQPVQNLFDLMSMVSSADTLAHFKATHANCSIRYGDMKKQLAEDMVTFLTPIREKIQAIHDDESLLSKVVKMGADKARESAGLTMKEVREAIGFKRFY
jgi:tryptophanyl-tRNA synthetase